jgi:hypothetical protein
VRGLIRARRGTSTSFIRVIRVIRGSPRTDDLQAPERSLLAEHPRRPCFHEPALPRRPLLAVDARGRAPVVPPGRPGLGRRAGGRGAGRGQPGGGRLGRGRPALRGGDDRLPRGGDRRARPAPGRRRRRRPVREGHRLRRQAAVPQRRPALEGGRPGHGGPEHLVSQGQRRRRPRRRAARAANRLRRGQPAAAGQRAAVGPGQLGLRGQRPQRRQCSPAPFPLTPNPSPHRGEGRRDGGLHPAARLPLPPGDGRGRGGRRLQPVRSGPRRLGAALPVVEHRPAATRRTRGALPEPQPGPGRDIVVGRRPRPRRRRARLPRHPAAADLQPRAGGLYRGDSGFSCRTVF